MSQSLDPKNLPKQADERQRLTYELVQKARAAAQQNQPLVASLCVADAVMLDPNDRNTLDVFDEIVLAAPDPLALFPVATGAIHVATAAGRARALMMQNHLDEALSLIAAILEVSPDLAYLDWVRRWLQPQVLPRVSWDTLFENVVKPVILLTGDVPVPPAADDPRLPNLRSADAIFQALLTAHADQKFLYVGGAMIKRRLGDGQGALTLASYGLQRFPNDWGLLTAALNGARDLRQPEQALQFAEQALAVDPDDLAPMHDAAWAFLEADRFDRAAAMFQQIQEKDPRYPEIRPCVHYARFRAYGSPEDRNALLLMRDREPWNDRAYKLAGEIDPARPFLTTLPEPGDAAAAFGRHTVEEFSELLRCCGRGASLSVNVQSQYPESPSAPLAFDLAMRAMGAAQATMTVEIEGLPSPDPRADKGRVDLPVWSLQNGQLLPTYAQGDPNAQHAVGSVAYQPFRKDVWDPAARAIAQQAGPQSVHAFMSVMTNPPAPPNDFDGILWTYRCQIAAAVILSHLGPWESGPARAALYSLISGPSDWTTIAGLVGLLFRAGDSPQHRAEVEGAYGWLRGLIPQEGFTPWEGALIECWLGLGDHPEHVQRDLLAWRGRFEDTVGRKNRVRTQRRHRGLSLEQYAEFCVQRDRLHAGLVYGGVGAVMDARFSPSPEMLALCNQYGVDPQRPYVEEWQEAINNNRGLQQRFLEAKRSIELGQMGIQHEEKAALDNVLAGNMDMHQRMAQAQQAQQSGAADQDPDPVVFPGQRVQRLSDYVRIMKGMQTGNMQGALAQYGLDMMSYGQVAQAWSAKFVADPVLNEKFSRMMAG